MLAIIQKILAWRFFSRRKENTGIFAIIAWWEWRRIPYNLIVGATGVLTLVVCGMVADLPDALVFGMIGYGIGANVCFTGGWFVEIIVREIWGERAGVFGQITFVLGLVFSILLTFAPAVLIVAQLVL